MPITHLIANATLPPISGIGAFAPDAKGNIDGPAQLEIIFTQIFGFLTIVAGLAFLIYFVIGAINWITGGHDEKKVEEAKSYMTNGAIGMIIIVAAYAIITIVGDVLGFKILQPANTLNKLFGI